LSHLELVSPTSGDPESIYQEFLDVFLASKSRLTRDAYRRDLRLFSRYCGLTVTDAVEMLLSSGQAKANLKVAAWKNMMLSNGLSSATVNRRLACIKAVATTAQDYGLSNVQITVSNEPSRTRRDTRGPELEAVKKTMRRLESDDSVRGILQLKTSI